MFVTLHLLNTLWWLCRNLPNSLLSAMLTGGPYFTGGSPKILVLWAPQGWGAKSRGPPYCSYMVLSHFCQWKLRWCLLWCQTCSQDNIESLGEKNKCNSPPFWFFVWSCNQPMAKFEVQNLICWQVSWARELEKRQWFLSPSHIIKYSPL